VDVYNRAVTVVTTGSGFVEKDNSNGENRAGDGSPLTWLKSCSRRVSAYALGLRFILL
jgi:hypothetical protein